MNETSCPCCGDPMEPTLVVCWTCFRITDRLSPGLHLDPTGATATNQGYAAHITNADITKWDLERTTRCRMGS